MMLVEHRNVMVKVDEYDHGVDAEQYPAGHVAHRNTDDCTMDCWYVAKRKGKNVRWRNACTGAWDRWVLAVWTPFDADGNIRSTLADEGWHQAGFLSEDIVVTPGKNDPLHDDSRWTLPPDPRERLRPITDTLRSVIADADISMTIDNREEK